nr:hypothetical protein GCM10020092_091490 [Actinoplanes digitatis]
MAGEQQPVGAVRVAHDGEPDQRRVREVERALAVLDGDPLRVALGDGDDRRHARADVLERPRVAGEA